jgi:hypothetical protein
VRWRIATHSDLSGRPLEGSDAPTAITVRFDDVENQPQRRLTISAAEAEGLSVKGSAAPSEKKPSRLWAWVKKHPWPVVVAAVAAYFTSVCIPALVQQWADRRAELDFKNTLITSLSDLVADTTTASDIISSHATPEAAARVVATRRAKSTGKGSPEWRRAKAALDSAEATEARAEQTLFNQTKVALIKDGAALETRLETYFNPHLAAAWATYRDVLEQHLNLVFARSDKERRSAQLNIYRFLCQGRKKLGPPEAGAEMRARCQRYAIGQPLLGADFRLGPVGNELLRRRRRVLGGIQSANADGYSVGFHDYACAVLVPRC